MKPQAGNGIWRCERILKRLASGTFSQEGDTAHKRDGALAGPGVGGPPSSSLLLVHAAHSRSYMGEMREQGRVHSQDFRLLAPGMT